MTLLVIDPLFAMNQLTLLVAFGVAAGLYFFIRGFRLLVRKRLLLDTPTSKIRSASLGLVEVSGKAVGPHMIRTPIAGIPCFLYRTTIWQKSDESRSGEWKKVAEETLHVPFYIDDGTSRLLIQPQGAELELHCDFRQDFSDTIFSPHATRETLNFLARHGVAPENKIRVEERSIRPQSELFVVGTLAENSGIGVQSLATDTESALHVSAGSRLMSSSPEVVRLSTMETPADPAALTQQGKIAAALTKAGISSPAAWNAAGLPSPSVGVGMPPQVQQVSVHGLVNPVNSHGDSDFNLTPPVVLMKGKNNPAFLILWRSQHDLVRSLAWKSAAMIWGGAALTLLALYVFLMQMNVL